MKNVENEVESLLSSLSLSTYPLPIEDICARLGLVVKPYDLGESVSGMLVLEGDRGFIGVNPTESKVRNRFTIAHELGHFILHRNQGRNLFVDTKVHFRDYNSSTGIHRLEREANAFAASILMPRKFVLSEVRSGEYDLNNDSHVSKLAKKFNVSSVAMSIRLSRLGLI